MTVRAATQDDLTHICEMGEAFHEASCLPYPHDGAAFSAMALHLIQGGGVFVTDRGMIGGGLVPSYANPDWISAVEIFWWSKGDGMSLLRAFEEWGRGHANEIRMTSLVCLPRADKILRNRGYAATEISYSKVF